MNPIVSLEEIFIKAFDDEKLQSRFFYELLSNEIYVLGTTEDYHGVLEEGSEVQVMSLRSKEGQFIPVFLSKESMLYFLEDTQQEYIKAKGMDLLETLKHNHIVINPGQKDTMVLYDDEIREILSQGKN